MSGFKNPDIYIGLPPLTGKPEQQQFTVRSGVLTSISSRQRSAFSSRPFARTNGLCTRSLQLDRPTYAMPQPAGLHPAMFSGNHSVATSEYYQALITAHLHFMEEWKAELA